MKKIAVGIGVLMFIVICMGCAKGSGYHVNLDELKKINGTMLEIDDTPQGEMTEKEFNEQCSTLSVSYAGYANYTKSVNQEDVQITDQDLLTIYEFCLDAVENGTYEKYSEDVDDGSTYSFIFYDENSEPHMLYSGYIYDNQKLSEIVQIIENYFEE